MSAINPISASLRLSSDQHAMLQAGLFVGDGLERVAIGLCRQAVSPIETVLLLRELHLVPEDAYISRAIDQVSWRTEWLVPLLKRAVRDGLSVLKIHCYPGGFPEFSLADDDSDRRLFRSVHGWYDEARVHGSVVVLPDGQMFGRSVLEDGSFLPLRQVTVVGDDILIWCKAAAEDVEAFAVRHAQLFGSATTAMLRALSVAVVGCSGTGSIVVEQLARLGVGRLVLIDPDVVEEKNLNRILNAGREDALGGRLKVEVLADAIHRMGLGTEVVMIPENMCDSPRAVRAAANADVLFGCMDSHEGRLMLNKIATYYLQPYFDLGVRADADGSGSVAYVGGMVHYLQPGKSSLLSRRFISLDRANEENLRRKHPAEYERLLDEKYIRGVAEDRPAVISLNTRAACEAVNEFLARLHPYRGEPSSGFARTAFDLTNGLLLHTAEHEFTPCEYFAKLAGRGDVVPLLDTPALAE